MPQNILIAGCGAVGSALARRYVAEGDRVWGIRRDVSALPTGVEPWRADLGEPASLGAPPADFDLVFYTAAAGARTEERYRRIYVDGLIGILELLKTANAPIRRAIFTSSTAVYGQNDGSWVDEESPTEPASFTGEILLEAESALAACPWPSTSVRLAGIYGPERTRLLEQVKSGTARISEGFTNRIHVEDCAGVLEHLASLDRVDPIVIGVDDEPAPMREVVGWMAEQLGVPAPTSLQDAPRGRGTNKRCSNRRLKASGYVLEFPTYREGYAPIAEAFVNRSAG